MIIFRVSFAHDKRWMMRVGSRSFRTLQFSNRLFLIRDRIYRKIRTFYLLQRQISRFMEQVLRANSLALSRRLPSILILLSSLYYVAFKSNDAMYCRFSVYCCNYFDVRTSTRRKLHETLNRIFLKFLFRRLARKLDKDDKEKRDTTR